MNEKKQKVITIFALVSSFLYLALSMITSPLILFLKVAKENTDLKSTSLYSALAFYLVFPFLSILLLVLFFLKLRKKDEEKARLYVECLLGLLVLYLLGSILIPLMNLKSYLLLVLGVIPGVVEIPLLVISLLEMNPKKENK